MQGLLSGITCVGRRQCDDIGRDNLAEPRIDGVPVEQVHPERQVALGAGFGAAGGLVGGQRAAGVDGEIEVGEAAGPAGGARAELPGGDPREGAGWRWRAGWGRGSWAGRTLGPVWAAVAAGRSAAKAAEPAWRRLVPPNRDPGARSGAGSTPSVPPNGCGNAARRRAISSGVQASAGASRPVAARPAATSRAWVRRARAASGPTSAIFAQETIRSRCHSALPGSRRARASLTKRMNASREAFVDSE